MTITINSATKASDQKLKTFYNSDLKKQLTPKLISDGIEEAITQSKKTGFEYKLELSITLVKK